MLTVSLFDISMVVNRLLARRPDGGDPMQAGQECAEHVKNWLDRATGNASVVALWQITRNNRRLTGYVAFCGFALYDR